MIDWILVWLVQNPGPVLLVFLVAGLITLTAFIATLTHD